MPPGYRNVNKRLNDLLSTSQSKSYFVGAVTVVFIVIMAMVGILPAYSAFTFQNEENAKRDEVIAKLTTKLQISQTLSKEYDSKIDVVNYFKEIFPDNPDQNGIITLLNDIALSNSSFLSKLSFNKNPSVLFAQSGYEEQIKSQQVSITVEGSQSALQNIVNDIESSGRMLNILNFTLDRKTAEDIATQDGISHGEYVLNVQMEYYYYTNLTSTDTL